MNRWGRIVLTLALAATIAWIAGGWLGFEVRDDASLARHTLLAFASLLALVLAHGWVAVYLLVFTRWARRGLPLSMNEASSLAATRRNGVVAASVAIVAALAQFAVSNALYPSRLDPGWHALAGLASAIVLLGALTLEGRSLARVGRLARDRCG